ncbi:MAG TPA: hypothetical protein VGM06_05510 [Polyangiaceae bacterium]
MSTAKDFRRRSWEWLYRTVLANTPPSSSALPESRTVVRDVNGAPRDLRGKRAGKA